MVTIVCQQVSAEKLLFLEALDKVSKKRTTQPSARLLVGL